MAVNQHKNQPSINKSLVSNNVYARKLSDVRQIISPNQSNWIDAGGNCKLFDELDYLY